MAGNAKANESGGNQLEEGKVGLGGEPPAPFFKAKPARKGNVRDSNPDCREPSSCE